MKLDTKKKRLWFVIWCLWSIGWFVAYIVGGFFVLRDCNLYRSAIMTCEFDFKLFGFIFFAFVIPAILIAATLMISKIKSWVSSGEQNFLTIQSSRPPTAAADFRRQSYICKISWFVFIQKTAQTYLTEYLLEKVLKDLFLKKPEPILWGSAYERVNWSSLQLKSMAKPKLILLR